MTGPLVLGASADMGRDWYGGSGRAETCWNQLLLLIGRARHNLSAWSLDPNVRLLCKIECCISGPGSFDSASNYAYVCTWSRWRRSVLARVCH